MWDGVLQGRWVHQPRWFHLVPQPCVAQVLLNDVRAAMQLVGSISIQVGGLGHVVHLQAGRAAAHFISMQVGGLAQPQARGSGHM